MRSRSALISADFESEETATLFSLTTLRALFMQLGTLQTFGFL